MSRARDFFVLTSFEILRIRAVLGAAIAIGVCGIIPRFVPSRLVTPDELQLITSLALTGVFVVLVVVPLIASTWTRGLRSGLLSFYFARPLGPGTLWLARLAASSSIAALGVLIASMPALPLVEDRLRAWLRELQPLQLQVLVATSIVVAMLGLGILNVLVLYLRRPRWPALLFLAVAGVSALLLALLKTRIEATSWTMTASLAPMLAGVAAACIGLLVASWRQIARGRIDASAATRANLRAFGAVMLCGITSVPSVAYWASHPTPAALDTRRLLAATPSAPAWSLIEAPLHLRSGDVGMFLVNTTNGRWLRLSAFWTGGCGRVPPVRLLVNEQGNRAAGVDFTSSSAGRSSTDLLSITLSDTAALRRRPIVRSNDGRMVPLAISFDGKLLAIAESGELSTYDLDTLERHCTGQGIPDHVRGLTTAGPTRERPMLAIAAPRHVYAGEPLDFIQVELRSCSVTTRPIVDALAADRTLLALDPASLTAVTYEESNTAPRDKALRIWSIESGILLGELPLAAGTYSSDIAAVHLEPGRILVSRLEEGQLQLLIIDPYGRPLDQVRLGPLDARILARLDDGSFLLGKTGWWSGSGRIYRFDPVSGEIETVVKNVIAATSSTPGTLPSSLLAHDLSTDSLVSISSDLRPHSVPLRWWP